MTEETIFAQALEKSTPSDRTAYLDQACAGDTVLRQRIETLLKSHEAEGDFLGKPAIQSAAEELAGQACVADTQGEVPADDEGVEALDFLAPSNKPGALGRLGHYEILEVIGRGGMGVVLRSVDEKLQRVVAIKVMAAQLATNATARKRFTREAQAAAAVTHDHLVTIHAVEEANGLPYLVMQYVSGMSLQERLDRSGPLELREIVRIGMQTAAGLAAAHAHGLIHRDIKPANILLENGVERVKITDFGLARAVADASLTQSGVVAGTPKFMSPEQARGEGVDQRTDMFSLGSVLYAMCTGRPPFRAESGMAVLKRVCDDIPSAIRETNPEIPDWLVAIVTKLHAKDPAERFQTAAEVAELLKDHLAHLQHPSVIGPVAARLSVFAETGARGEATVRQPAPRRRRWALAAAALLFCLVGGMGFTEATGVTSLRSTVIRIFTPDGTLVVEVDDPGVKVTVEGDGGLVITGAGLEEIRLRPGTYKVHADRDGKRLPLERELVSIAKNGREVVKVKLEAPPAQAAATTEKGAFVLLAAGKERKFDTLAEAVAKAQSGDTIEIRGNGPFETDPVRIRGRALVIRAGAGCRPVLKLSAKGNRDDLALLLTDVALVLEGLEFQRIGSGPANRPLIESDCAPLHVANCQFVVKDNNAVGIWGTRSPAFAVRNCAIFGSRCAVESPGPKEGLLSVDNCLLASSSGVVFHHSQPVDKMRIQLTRNTFAGNHAVLLPIYAVPDFSMSGDKGKAKCFDLQAEDNVFDVAHSIFCLNQNTAIWKDKPIATAESKKLVADLLDWRERSNLYPLKTLFMVTKKPGDGFETLLGPEHLNEWQQFAGSDAGSLRGKVRFAGGDLFAKAFATPELLQPKHFSLLPESPGHGAGKDGKDLGADVDLVGPGPAYERWKKTPEYQQWLKDTKQAAASFGPDRKAAEYVLKANAHVAAGRLDEAAKEFSRLLDLMTADSSWNDPEMKRIVAQIVASDEVFPRVVKLGPKVIELWYHRAHHLADQGRWDESEVCFRTRLELWPDGAGTWFCYAAAALAAHHHDTYRQICESMLKEFGEVTDPQEARLASWAMAIAPHSVKDQEKALRLAERAMKGHPNASYGASVYAAWLYRLNRLDESVACWEKIAKDDPEGMRLCFLAMAHHRLGNSDLADRFVKQARSKKADWSKLTRWDHRVRYEQLLNEMEKVVSGKPD